MEKIWQGGKESVHPLSLESLSEHASFFRQKLSPKKGISYSEGKSVSRLDGWFCEGAFVPDI
jgi:hypothetical protein